MPNSTKNMLARMQSKDGNPSPEALAKPKQAPIKAKSEDFAQILASCLPGKDGQKLIPGS